MKGLQGNTLFTDYLTSYERKTLKRLAEIEKEDADRCAECGGEDCVCCEYWIDRQKWKSPDELFAHEFGDPLYEDEDYRGCWDDEDEEDELI